MKTNLITLTNLADAYKKDLFVLRVDTTDTTKYDLDKLEDRLEYYARHDVFALGKLTGNHYAEFERKFGRSLDRFQSQWLAAVLYDTSRSTGEVLEGITFVEAENAYYTPAGKLEGSPEINMLKCLAFLFSCFGRVVSEDEDGEFELEKVSENDVMEYIDLNLLQSAVVVDGDEESFVWRVLGTARGFSVYAPENEEEETASKDDELKNSTPENESSPSTKSTTKRSRTKK